MAALAATRSELDDVQELTGVGSWEMDVPRGTFAWSRQMYVLLGLDPATTEPGIETFLARVVEADRAGVEAAIGRVSDGHPLEFDARVSGPAGECRWVRGRGRMTYAEDGAARLLRGTVQDVTSARQLELELLDAAIVGITMQTMASAANSAATLDEALQVMRHQLLSHDDWRRAVILLVEVGPDAGLRLDPWAPPGTPRPLPEELCPSALEQRVAERVLTGRSTVFEEEARPGAPLIGFLVSLGAEPRAVVVISTGSPFERREMLETVVDQVAAQLARVVEREHAAAEQAAARDTAVEASRLKSEFLAMMSHEIRTPMNGVLGLNELLLGTDLDPHQRRLAEGARLAGSALLALINDVLDFSKIEAGELALEEVEFALRPVLDQVVATVAGTAEEKQVHLVVQVDDDVPERLVGDPTRLGQVVSNLVSNAVKFTARGAVAVTVEVVPSVETPSVEMPSVEMPSVEPVETPSVETPSVEPVETTLRVQVTDTGIGIAPEQVERLFEPFRQADASTTRSFGGTGLGLAISRRLVSALGGELGVTSEPGTGSCFFFTARFQHPSTRTATRTPTESRPDRLRAHVLVVEDNEVNQLVARGQLGALGCTVDVAAHGLEAVAMTATTAYDVVLMDLQMPHLDGYSAARRIRRTPGCNTEVPIIAMTASALSGERERCLSAGMDGFMTKPVSADRLATVLGSHLPHLRRSPQREPDPPEVVDFARLAELDEMGDTAAALVDQAVERFVSGVPRALAELTDAAQGGDLTTLAAAAHRFRGSALNLGANRVAALSLDLELLGPTDVGGRAPALLAGLEAAADEAVRSLLRHRARAGAGGGSDTSVTRPGTDEPPLTWENASEGSMGTSVRCDRSPLNSRGGHPTAADVKGCPPFVAMDTPAS